MTQLGSKIDPQDEATRLMRSITSEAEKASRDPAYARKVGIVPTIDMSLFASGADQQGPARTKAAWLRGAVIALLPRGWRYEIVEAIGGDAYLMLASYEPPARPDRCGRWP